MESLQFDVPGIGHFAAHHRTIGLQIKIAQAYRREIGGNDDDAPEALRTLASIKAHLEHQIAEAPEGWSLDTASVEDCYEVWAALRAADDTFRRGVEAQRPGRGEETQQDANVVVS